MSKQQHGQTGTRLHGIWLGMMQRTGDPNTNRANSYHDKGITICDEWKVFLVFKEWSMYNGYRDTLSIDRINNDGNYEPSNCKWSTVREQSENRSTSNKVVGVQYVKRLGKYRGYINIKKLNIHLGCFKELEVACLARELAKEFIEIQQ